MVGDRILGGEFLTELQNPCLRLMKITGLVIARIFFVESADDDGSWKFAGLDPHPDLESQEAVFAVVELLESLYQTAQKGTPYT